MNGDIESRLCVWVAEFRCVDCVISGVKSVVTDKIYFGQISGDSNELDE